MIPQQILLHGNAIIFPTVPKRNMPEGILTVQIDQAPGREQVLVKERLVTHRGKEDLSAPHQVVQERQGLMCGEEESAVLPVA